MIIPLKIQNHSKVEFTTDRGQTVRSNRYKCDYEPDSDIVVLTSDDDMSAYIGKSVRVSLRSLTSKVEGVFEARGSFVSPLESSVKK